MNGNPPNGVKIDFLQIYSNVDIGKTSDDEELTSPSVGNATVIDTFGANDKMTINNSGHSFVTSNITTDDGHGNTSRITGGTFNTFGLVDGWVKNDDPGSETLIEAGGIATTDNEGDTRTISGELDPTRTITSNPTDIFVTIDPVTSLKTTTTFTASTSDIIHKKDTFGGADVHSSSLTNPGSDIRSGKNTLTGDETTDETVTNDVHILGSLSPGETVDAENKFYIADNTSDLFSNIDTLTVDGTDTITSTFGGPFTITALNVNNSILETKTDPATGNTTTISIVDWLGGKGKDTEGDSDTKVTVAGGTTTDIPVIGDSGQLEEGWSLSETVGQRDSGGNLISPSVTTTNVGSDIVTLLNGVSTDPGGTNTNTVTNGTTSTTTTTTATAAAAGAPSGGNGMTNAAPPGVDDIHYLIIRAQGIILTLKKQVAEAEAMKLAIEKSWVAVFGYTAWQKEELARLDIVQKGSSAAIAELEAKLDNENLKLAVEDQSFLNLKYQPLEVVDINAAGRPGFWVSIIPVYGSAANAAASFNEGTVSGAAWGTGFTLLAFSDILLVRSAGTALFKGGAKLFAQKATVDTAATGAYNAGAKAGGTGLGILTGKEIAVSKKGIQLVETHLAQFGSNAPNTAMIIRLKAALQQGKKIEGADASFYLHEAFESTRMAKGIPYEIAHQAALLKYAVSPFSIYHIDVILAFKSFFNKNWITFWNNLK